MRKQIVNLSTKEIIVRDLTPEELELREREEQEWEDGAVKREEIERGEKAKIRIEEALLLGDPVSQEDRDRYRRLKEIGN